MNESTMKELEYIVKDLTKEELEEIFKKLKDKLLQGRAIE